MVVALAVYALVPNQAAAHADQSSPLSQVAGVLRIGLSHPLRGLIAISLVSLAASLVLLLALMAAGAPHFPVSELSGLAVMQSTTGVVGGVLGLPAVLLFMAAALIIGTAVFLLYT